MQVKLPPVQVIRVEGEVIVLSTVTGVGQHVPPAFGEAQEDVPVVAERRIRHSIHIADTDRMFSSPCSEELLTDDGLQRDTDTRREFSEEPLRELPIQLKNRQTETLIQLQRRKLQLNELLDWQSYLTKGVIAKYQDHDSY